MSEFEINEPQGRKVLKQNGERFRTFFEDEPELCYMVSPEGKIMDVNKAALDILGYSRWELVGQPVSVIYAPEELPKVGELFKKWQQTGTLRNEELVIQTRAGEKRTVLLSVNAARDSSGRILYSISVQRDVTEWRKTEEELVKTVSRFKEAQRIAHIGSWELDLVNDILTWSDEIYRIFEINPTEFGASYKAFLATIHPDDREAVDSAFTLSVKSHTPYSIDHRLLLPDGRIKFVREQGETSYDAEGRPLCSIGTVQDITKRAQAEQQVNLLDFALNHVREAAFLVDQSARFQYVNQESSRILGYTHEELLDLCITDIDPDFSLERWPDHWENLKAHHSLTFESRLRAKDGTIFPVEINANYFEYGERSYNLALVRDITERKRVVETLRKRENFIRMILDSVDEGFIVVDRQCRIMSANKAFCNLVGASEGQVIGRTCYEVSHHAVRPCYEEGKDCPVWRTFEAGTVYAAFHIHEDAAGEKQYVEVKSYPVTDGSETVVAAIETVNDLTEKRKLEEQLGQAQKMEAIGTLAGAVAHDFNNILTAIIGYGHIMQMRMKPGDPNHASMDQILKSADLAAQLTQGLLAFSRKQDFHPQPVEINSIVKSVEKLLKRLIGEDIDLSTCLAREDLVVMADPGQIDQVLINLATNARDAMPGGGSLTITTQVTELGNDWISAPGDGAQKYALVSVSDTGCGMEEQTRKKIFEPFFTTKGPGEGSGLGLAIVYGIIKQHKGSIIVDSEPGKGTTFRLALPMIARQTKDLEPVVLSIPPRGTETILLAEDDRSVGELLASILTNSGYRVISAVDGQEAIERFSELADDIDLMVLDGIMPKKNGREVYDFIKSRRPDVAVLFISGYPVELLDKRGVSQEGMHFLAKPVSPHALLQKVRDLLDKTNECS